MDEHNYVGYLVLALAIIVPLLIAVIRPIVNLTKSITTLNANAENLAVFVNSTVNKNTESHRRIHVRIDETEERIDGVEGTVNDHEKRLYHIENKEG